MSARMSQSGFNNQGEYLFGIMSGAEDRYIDEMLSDDTAAEIKAVNKRSRIRMHSAFAVVAAGLALVIGLSALPDRSGLKNDEAGVENTVGLEQYEDNNRTDNAELAGNTQDKHYDAAEEENETDAIYDNETEEVPADEIAEDKQIPHNGIDGETSGGLMQNGNSASPVMELRAENGISYRLSGWSAAEHRGKFESYSSDGTAAIFEFDNFPTDAIALAYIDGEYVILINSDIRAENLGDIFRKFGFRYYLHCDGVSVDGSAAMPYTDADFQSEAWEILFTDAAGMARADAPDTEGRRVTYRCRIGTDEETYADIDITADDGGYLLIELAGQSLWFENPNAAQLVGLY